MYVLTESAFYVGISAPAIPSGFNRLPFKAVSFSNKTSPYSAIENTFSVSQPSLYWFHLCVGVPANTTTYNRLNGLSYPTVIYSTAAVYPMDRLCVDTLQWVDPAVPLTVSNNQSLFSSSNLEIAWLGFRLDNTLSPLIAFDVQLTYDYATDSSTEDLVVNFNRVILNLGNSYHISNNTFIVPLSGAYFFSITTPNKIQMTVNNQSMLAVCVCDDKHGEAIGSGRGSVMVSLNKDDAVRAMVMHTGLNVTGNPYGLTSFRGFLYSPLFQLQTAWSVARSVLQSYSGPINYLPHNIVFTNINEPWRSTLNKVIIPITGTYFIDLTSYLCGSGWGGDGNCEMNVMLNGNPIVVTRLSVATFSNCISRSRSTIVKLLKDDELWVNIPTVGLYYNDDRRMQTFTGFLLY